MTGKLSLLGWLFMILSWVSITGLNVFCFMNILKDKTEEIVDPMIEIDREGD
jgi:hypothetical protein